MSSLKHIGKCIGRACGLQGSEFHNVYDELKAISALGANTQTRKNRLASVSARLNTLARTRALKTNLSKVNALRLAHNVLNGQRSNSHLFTGPLLSRYSAFKSRKNKPETEELVKMLLNQEIRHIRKRHMNIETNKHIWELINSKRVAEESAELKNTRKTLAVIKKMFPRETDEKFLKHLVGVRRLALLSEVTDEDEVSRDPRKAAAVDRFFTERISQEMMAANKTFGPRIISMPNVPAAANTRAAGSGAPTGRSRKTRKAGRR